MEGKGKLALILGCSAGCVFLLCLLGGVAAVFVVPQLDKQMHPKPEPVYSTPTEDGGEEPWEPTSTPEDGAALPSLAVEGFRFTEEGYQGDNGGIYRLGEKIYYAFDITGVSRDGSGNWSIKMDLTVTAPTGELVLDKNMVDQDGSLPEPLPLTGYVELPPEAPAGTYTLRSVTRDKQAAVEVVEEHLFEMQ